MNSTLWTAKNQLAMKQQGQFWQIPVHVEIIFDETLPIYNSLQQYFED